MLNNLIIINSTVNIPKHWKINLTEKNKIL